MSEYVTIQGDMWDSIAYKIYGSEYRMQQLMEANPKHLNTVIFPAGIRLTVPSLPEAVSDDMPPWRRGS